METIHIALTFDNNYVEQSVVLMTSILANKGNENIHFHILDGGLNIKTKKRIFEINNCKTEFHLVNTELFKNYKKTDYYPQSMLWTMILPDIIPVNKLLYLDCDMVVNTSLRELWQTDLDDNYIAAVEDANGKKYAKRFGLKKNPVNTSTGLAKQRTKGFSKFFNTGTMLINCQKWHKDDIPKKAVEMSMNNTGTALGYDQTVLNKLFEDKVKFLDLKWNLQYCPINIWSTYDSLAEYKDAIETPAIIHYVGDYKPWKPGLGCFNPKQKDYFKYQKLTSFAKKCYPLWFTFDRLFLIRGIWALIKRYPTFFLRKQFWTNIKNNFLMASFYF